MRINLKSKNLSIPLIIPLMVAIGVLCLSFLASLTFGVANIAWQDLPQAFTAFDGSTSHLIITTIRLPRSIVALLVGAGLGVAGSLMQGITRNPLADPSILGINSGAVLAVVITTFLVNNPSLNILALFAFLGATISAMAVYFFASLSKKIYLIFGLIAVIFSSISAILTFSDFTNKIILFFITFLSTVSAYILTFLNPSGREEKRRQCVKRSSALLEKVKTTKRLIGLKTEIDILDKLSSFSEQFASLIEDSLN